MTHGKVQQIQAIDRLVHEPVRLAILTILTSVEAADFNFLVTALGLSKGNLASHIAKLEWAAYVTIHKQFVGKVPRTSYAITPAGRQAYSRYWQTMGALQPLAAAEPAGRRQARLRRTKRAARSLRKEDIPARRNAGS